MSIEKTIQSFADRVQREGLGVEGIGVADEKKVILERRFAPDLPRNLYSHTKSFTSTAVGIAVTEGMMTVSDRLAEYFPEYLPENPHPWLMEIRLRDLLTMSSGFGYAFLMSNSRRRGEGLPDYAAYMIRQKMQSEPGKRFVYSNGDTYLAGRMLEKATGQRLGEYLYRKMFAPMGMGWPVWEHDPQGHAFGAAGLHLTLREMMKLGQLYIADGMWEGRRILTHDWIAQATTKQIETMGQTPDVSCGYGYQMWMNPYPGSSRADGAYGQLTVILPKQGLVVGIQCPESGDFEKVRPVIYGELLPELIEKAG